MVGRVGRTGVEVGVVGRPAMGRSVAGRVGRTEVGQGLTDSLDSMVVIQPSVVSSLGPWLVLASGSSSLFEI